MNNLRIVTAIIILISALIFSIWFLVNARKQSKELKKEKEFGKRNYKQMEKILR